MINQFSIITNIVQDASNLKRKIDNGESNHRTLSDWGKIYEWHKTCKACRDGDKRRGEVRISNNLISIEPDEKKEAHDEPNIKRH